MIYHLIWWDQFVLATWIRHIILRVIHYARAVVLQPSSVNRTPRTGLTLGMISPTGLRIPITVPFGSQTRDPNSRAISRLDVRHVHKMPIQQSSKRFASWFWWATSSTTTVKGKWAELDGNSIRSESLHQCWSYDWWNLSHWQTNQRLWLIQMTTHRKQIRNVLSVTTVRFSRKRVTF